MLGFWGFLVRLLLRKARMQVFPGRVAADRMQKRVESMASQMPKRKLRIKLTARVWDSTVAVSGST